MPWPSTPPEIAELMVSTCGWEKFLGFDGHAEPSYAPRITLKCYQEAHSMLQTGLEAKRVADLTTSDPDFDLIFAGDDPNALQFNLYDRFIAGGVADNPLYTLQPDSINTVFGPFDNTHPWLIVVAFA